MPARDPGTLPAWIVTLERGMSSALDPRLILPNQAALLVNLTVRGGFPRQRPGWKKIDLTYESEGQRRVAETGRFQGATFFQPRTGIPMLVSCISGRQFRYDVWGGDECHQIGTNIQANPSNVLQVWWVSAEDFLIMQDGQTAPWVFNGGDARRLGARELPVGTIMEYALGRIWVALPDRRSFVAGDLVYSSSGTPTYGYRDAVLKFTENEFLNEGGAFAVPVDAGRINAIRYIPNLDTSLGQGPIEIFTANGAFSVNAPFDRSTWNALQYPIQSVSLASPGALSQNSTVRINGDIWFRGEDGIRSFIVARRDFGMWGNVPMSEEMQRLLKYDGLNLLEYSSAVLFDNRLLMTATPQWDATHGCWHKALAVLDFNLLSSMGQRSPPAWDGMWTGLRILQIVTGEYQGVQRCFAFALNDDSEIELWELTKDAHFDFVSGQGDLRITSALETRLFDYASANSLKALERGDVALEDLMGTVDATLKYRTDDMPCWKDWHEFEVCATSSECAPEECLTLDQFQKSYRSRITFPKPAENVCEDSQARPANLGFTNQVRLEWTGSASIKRLALYSRVMQEAPFEQCTDETECSENVCCVPDNYFMISEAAVS